MQGESTRRMHLDAPNLLYLRFSCGHFCPTRAKPGRAPEASGSFCYPPFFLSSVRASELPSLATDPAHPSLCPTIPSPFLFCWHPTSKDGSTSALPAAAPIQLLISTRCPAWIEEKVAKVIFHPETPTKYHVDARSYIDRAIISSKQTAHYFFFRSLNL